MNEFKIIAATVIMMTTLVGCATKAPTTGDFMRMHAAEEKATGVDQKQMAKEWDQGSALNQSGVKLVKHGEDLVKSGEKDITTGKQEIEQGNKDIAEGTKLMEASKQKFLEAYPDQKLDLNK
ncbi:hypothetical protein [Sulfuricurvum sp.]|uniref:hypothetical protein n=1 Tax=Sulfuricurvum sp. TaxID=2025608 RepID=UPI0035658445